MQRGKILNTVNFWTSRAFSGFNLLKCKRELLVGSENTLELKCKSFNSQYTASLS